MNKTRFVHAPPLDTLAVILVACSFGAICLLWPASKTSGRGSSVAPRGTRFIFRAVPVDDARYPTFFVSPPIASSGMGVEDFDMNEAIVPGRIDLSKLLGRPDPAGEPGSDLDLSDTSPERLVRPYVNTPVFAAPPAANLPAVRVAVSGALRTRNFDTSVLSTTPMPKREGSWVLRVFLEVDERGTVTQALLETPTADAELNSAALRAVYGSRAAPGAQPCDGVIVVSGTGSKARAQ